MVQNMVGVQSLIRRNKKIVENLGSNVCLYLTQIIIIYHIFVAFNNEQNQI